jgi:lipid II:glycine glycyltransferase (peptidoglycan interpeptide bridge formation enzyme)
MKNNTQLWSLEEINKDSWDDFFPKVGFSNLMQSWEYGEAKMCEGWSPKRFLLFDSHKDKRGLLQILVKEVPFFGGIIRINRGPIWFKGGVNNMPDEDELCGLWKTIRKHMFNKRWWFISCAPECLKMAESKRALLRAGYHFSKKKIPYGSSKLPLIDNNIDFLFMNLKKKWRNLLRKGQKLGVNLIEVTDKDKIRELVLIYENFQKIKKFDGVSSSLLHSMFAMSSEHFKIKVYQTLDGDNTQISGFVFIAYTGNTATYLVGWSNEIGRTQQANYLLIWKGIEDAKKAGLSWFDLGGINANTPKGVAHFKNGVNAKYFQNVGEYWSFFSI